MRTGDVHIDKEIRALTTCFNNLPLSIKSDLAFLAQLPRRSSFSLLLILLRVWNLKQWGLRWPNALQWWQTMGLGPLGLLRRDLATWFCSLLNIEHWGLMWPITPQWWPVGTNSDPLKSLGMRPKWRLRLKSLSLHFLVSFMWRNVHRFVIYSYVLCWLYSTTKSVVIALI